MSDAVFAVTWVVGEDSVLVAQETRMTVERLVGASDALVEDFNADRCDPALVRDALASDPLFGGGRIVVVRRLDKAPVALADRLAVWLTQVSPDVRVVVTSEGAITHRKLKAALSTAQRSDTAAKNAAQRRELLRQRIERCGVRVDAAGVALLEEHLGDDLGAVDGILASLGAAFGEDTHLGVAEVAQALGEPGGIPPWKLLDAIAAGNAAAAFDALRRTVGTGRRHPLQLVALLRNQYAKVLRLASSGVRTDAEAQSLVGGAAFTAKKLRAEARRLGVAGAVDGTCHISWAERALKGGSGLSPDAVMEVLVSRLAVASSSTAPAVGR